MFFQTPCSQKQAKVVGSGVHFCNVTRHFLYFISCFLKLWIYFRLGWMNWALISIVPPLAFLRLENVFFTLRGAPHPGDRLYGGNQAADLILNCQIHCLLELRIFDYIPYCRGIEIA